MRFIFLLIALALLMPPCAASWGEPLITQGTCYERAIQYGTAMEQQGIPYKIGMSESPYHVWILRDGRAIEPGFGYVEDWRVPGVDYYHPWKVFDSVWNLRQYVETTARFTDMAKAYYYNNVSDLRECDTEVINRFVHCN